MQQLKLMNNIQQKVDEPYSGIVNKLPSFNKRSNNVGGTNMLNVKIGGSTHDRCHNCFNVENKLKSAEKKCNQLKCEITEYQKIMANYKSRPTEVKETQTSGKAIENKDVSTSTDSVEELATSRTSGDDRSNKESEDETTGEENSGDKHLGKTSKKQGKDHSKLCNEFVWSGRCKRSRCIFAHKKLCKQLEKEGECTKDSCIDGHNVEGICRNYNRGTCTRDKYTCRYLHIRIGKKNWMMLLKR